MQCDTALQEALERLQKLLEVFINHDRQVQAENYGMQLQGTQHIQLLQGQLYECENAKTMLLNRLKSLQAQPVSRVSVAGPVGSVQRHTMSDVQLKLTLPSCLPVLTLIMCLLQAQVPNYYDDTGMLDSDC